MHNLIAKEPLQAQHAKNAFLSSPLFVAFFFHKRSTVGIEKVVALR